MLKTKKVFGFTIVELVVIISILAVLSLLSFLSFVGYSKDARDTTRVTNVDLIYNSLKTVKASKGRYPVPDNQKEITYQSKVLWRHGIVGKGVSTFINSSLFIDPKYQRKRKEAELYFSYGVLEDNSDFQIGTIVEDENNAPISLITSSYAENEKAYNNGSFNGLYVKTFTGGETHIFSVPSLIINDTNEHDIILNNVNDYFSISGSPSLPGKYYDKSTTSKQFDFIPRMLYKGPNCGVQTDQEIVDFIYNMNDSYNIEPFKSLSYYDEIFEDYAFLKANFEDFEQIKVLGLKINKSLKCDLDNFKTSDVFPISCGLQDGTFEYIDDLTNINNTCLYKYTGGGSAIVKDATGFDFGNGATKGLHIDGLGNYETGDIKYQVFSYKPIKINFDYKTIFIDSRSFLKFYIDDIEYLNTNPVGTSTFNSYEGVLLPAGLHEFKWEIYKRDNFQTEVFIDNIILSCIGGGIGCGWTDFTASGSLTEFNSLEIGDITPSDIFGFGGNMTLPWKQVTGIGNVVGSPTSYAIKISDEVAGNREITFSTSFSSTRKIEFDIKTNIIYSRNYGDFYINGVIQESFLDGGTSDGNYIHYESPLLPAGDYDFKWVSYLAYSYDTSEMWLDNISFSCIGGATILGNEGCGWTDFTSSGATSEFNGLEKGNYNPSDIFDFTGTYNFPWSQVTGVGNVVGASNTYAIKISNKITGNRNLILTGSFASPRKIKFDVKTNIDNNSGYGEFSINGRVYQKYLNGGINDGNYINYESPLLPAGDYEFKWLSYKGSSIQNSEMWLDNISYTCIGGGNGCGWTDFSTSGSLADFNGLEKGAVNPWDIFWFESIVPWEQVTGTGNVVGDPSSYAIKIDLPYDMGNREMTYTGVFSSPAKIKFDIKTQLSGGSQGSASFRIDGVEYVKYINGGLADGNWVNFESPMLGTGTHIFTWISFNGNSNYDSKMWLDNIQITCKGGASVAGNEGCGITDFTASGATIDSNVIESGNYNTFDIFTSTGSSPFEPIIESGASNLNGNTGSSVMKISHPNLAGNRKIELTKNFTSPQKIEFDIKTELSSGYSKASFLINGVEYGTYKNGGSSDGNWVHFESPLLGTGSYTLTWRSTKNHSGFTSNMWLDNIEFTCKGGGTGCGWTDFTASGSLTDFNPVEKGDYLPKDLFIFTGATSSPWKLEPGASNLNGNTGSSVIFVDFNNIGGSRKMIYSGSISSPRKIEFDIKTNLNDNRAYGAFYINGILYSKFSNGSTSDGNWIHYESPLLDTGNYELTWESYHYSPNFISEMWLDNIEFTCIGGATVSGNEGCGWEDLTLDKGNNDPWSLFTFSGAITTPWQQVTGPGNIAGTSEDYTYAIKLDSNNTIGDRDLTYTTNLSTPQKIEFDIKTELYSLSNVKFYIDGVLQITYSDGGTSDGNYVNYQSAILSTGNHTFLWKSYMYGNGVWTGWRSKMWLDNIKFTP